MLFISSSTSSSSTPPKSHPHAQPQQKRPKSEEVEAVYELIPGLPDDVALNCLARVPRSQHRTLSHVSKRIRSLLSSPLFFNARSLLHTTEHLLYLITYSFTNGLQWFTLYPNPIVLAPIPPIPSPSDPIDAAYAVLGPNIYVIGGSIHGISTPQVWVLNCRFNRWQAGPTMRLARRGPAASVADGKIYVMGGCEGRSRIWAEMLDPAVGRWQEVASPFDGEVHPSVYNSWRRSVYTSQVVDGKVYAVIAGGDVCAYDPRNRVWESLDKELWLGCRGRTCVVGGVLYSCDSKYTGKIKSLDVRHIRHGWVYNWKELKGLDSKFWGGLATLASVGGNLLVFWRCQRNGKLSEIWCAQVEVNNNGDDAELWGKVCWSQIILSTPWSSGCFIEQCLPVVL